MDRIKTIRNVHSFKFSCVLATRLWSADYSRSTLAKFQKNEGTDDPRKNSVLVCKRIADIFDLNKLLFIDILLLFDIAYLEFKKYE